MKIKKLPRFTIYQPNQKEFHICLQVGDKYIRWCSYYPPTLDTRYSRDITRIADLPAKKLPKKHIFYQGTYTITRSGSKDLIEKKMLAGIEEKTFSFSLDGKKLKGRFAIKQNKTGTVLQKYKDKYAIEEDVLSGDLSRTISAMIPDYDESKVKLTKPGRSKKVSKKEEEEEQLIE